MKILNCKKLIYAKRLQNPDCPGGYEVLMMDENRNTLDISFDSNNKENAVYRDGYIASRNSLTSDELKTALSISFSDNENYTKYPANAPFMIRITRLLDERGINYTLKDKDIIIDNNRKICYDKIFGSEVHIGKKSFLISSYDRDYFPHNYASRKEKYVFVEEHILSELGLL